MALNATPAVCSLVHSLALTVASRRGSLKGPSLPVLPRRSLLGSIAFHSFMLGSSSSVAARSKLSEAEQILKNVDWPEQFPFKKEDFQRFDESQDTIFYSSPRFVTHIDDPAIQALTKYYASVFPPSNSPGVSLLDMCSSWISHYPKGYKQERIAGLGLNEEELKRNPVLTEYLVQDLNQNTALPYEDNSFDIITNAALDISPSPGRTDPMYVVFSRKVQG